MKECFNVETVRLELIEVGIQGPAGGLLSTVNIGSFVAATGLIAGQAVYIDPTNGKATIADAADYLKCGVVGFVANNVQMGSLALIKSGVLTLPDWTLLTGVATLRTGKYYLALGGGYTVTPQTTVNIGCGAVTLGWALNANTFLFNAQPAISI